MTASADKVQYLLENSLEQSVGLVRKGIFTQPQLQAIMLRRQKCENAMLKKQYKMTDYLGSIEYEYELERERRKRMSEMAKLEEGSNPLFRKQSSADFAIVKRIIRLWDRTMHKYKFKLHLWKQYLSFTIAINSKKHFYKTLTNALKFLPFEIDLWKIGATYEMEYGMNMWKGRRILIKGLKMVPQGEKNLSLTQFMIGYELHFLRVLLERKSILIKGQQPLKMIGEEQENLKSSEEQEAQPIETMNLEKYDELIWLIVEEAISKNTKAGSKQFSFHTIKARLLDFLKKKKQEETNSESKAIIVNVITKLNNFELQIAQEPEVKHQSRFKLEGEEHQNTPLKHSHDLNLWKEKIIEDGTKINWQIAQQALKTFCLKPLQTADLWDFLLRVNPSDSIKFLSTKKANQKLPGGTLLNLIELYMSERSEQLVKLIKVQIDRWVSPSDLRDQSNLFEKISQFNARQGRLESTTRILRSLSIAYSHQHDFLSQCNRISSKTA